MTTAPFDHLLRRSFNFLQPTAQEVRQLFPDASVLLPTPYPLYLEDETATPFQGFPVVQTEGLSSLREALAQYLDAEEEAQLAAVRREPFSRTSYSAAWTRYRTLLAQAVQNATMSSYGRHYPALFWLLHSLDVARRLKEVPRRVVRLDLELGRRHGDQIKYRIFEKYRGQARQVIYEVVSRLASDIEDVEEGLMPHLLHRMFDNVLIFTEEHISADLSELGSYLTGFLGVDGRDLRQRLERLAEWHAAALREDPELQAAAHHLAGAPLLAGGQSGGSQPRSLLHRSGYVSFLSVRRGYRPNELLTTDQVQLWESLLVKLKEFELLEAMRSLVLPVKREGERLVFRAGGLDRTWIGQRLLHLSPSTRPLDFMSPSVIDPLVHRYGLIYDITNFSEVVSLLRRAGLETQEQAFRQMFRFQRRINRLASAYRLQLEKYLGDGAFYTSRSPASMLLCAIHLQRLYRLALTSGLPFNQGMRVGLNYGHYRLIPIQASSDGEPERYEFFGHGVVELSRLTSGKSAQEIEEIKNILVSYGYPQQAVQRFFEPLAGRNLDLVDKEQEDRPFYAYVNRNGSLINEGIVATEEYVGQLAATLASPQLYRCREASRSYVVLALEDGTSQLYVGLRKLGVAHLKGLDDLPVYEVVDATDLADREREPLSGLSLTSALDRLAAGTYAVSHATR